MRPTPPATGIYTSDAKPGLRLLIDNVTTPEPDGFFLVEAVELGDDGDDSGMGIELTGDEWADMQTELALRPAHHATA